MVERKERDGRGWRIAQSRLQLQYFLGHRKLEPDGLPTTKIARDPRVLWVYLALTPKIVQHLQVGTVS